MGAPVLGISHFGLLQAALYDRRYGHGERRATMQRSEYNERYRDFRRLLVQARKDAGLTQVDLAIRLERPQSYVSKYENGERRVDLVEFLEIAEILAIDVPRFLRELGSANRP